MQNLCNNCVKSGSCYFEAQNLICKKQYENIKTDKEQLIGLTIEELSFGATGYKVITNKNVKYFVSAQSVRGFLADFTNDIFYAQFLTKLDSFNK